MSENGSDKSVRRGRKSSLVAAFRASDVTQQYTTVYKAHNNVNNAHISVKQSSLTVVHVQVDDGHALALMSH
jgi:hypothetical protein